MGLEDGGDFWPGDRSAGFAEMPLSSLATCGAVDPPPVANSILSSNIVEQSLMGDWSLLVSVAQHMNFDGFMIPSSSGVSVQADKGTSAALDTNLPGFNNGGISQIMTSTSLPANGQGTGPLCSADLGHSVERGDLNSNLKKKRKTEEDGAFGTQYPLSRILVAEAGQKKEMVSKPAENPIKEELKEKDEQNPSTNTQKLASEQTKEDSSKGDIVKQDYVHLRAKRGHATNSHSLAERVRRQKISERMKFLQDLVPGCSKITGKAMMLDEIINYVQSLQHQVEFLSMKLADVNPEVNLDAEKILSEGVVFYSQTGVSDALGFSPGFASSLPPSQR